MFSNSSNQGMLDENDKLTSRGINVRRKMESKLEKLGLQWNDMEPLLKTNKELETNWNHNIREAEMQRPVEDAENRVAAAAEEESKDAERELEDADAAAALAEAEKELEDARRESYNTAGLGNGTDAYKVEWKKKKRMEEARIWESNKYTPLKLLKDMNRLGDRNRKVLAKDLIDRARGTGRDERQSLRRDSGMGSVGGKKISKNNKKGKTRKSKKQINSNKGNKINKKSRNKKTRNKKQEIKKQEIKRQKINKKTI